MKILLDGTGYLQFLAVTMWCVENFCFICYLMWVTKSGVEDLYPLSEKNNDISVH